MVNSVKSHVLSYLRLFSFCAICFLGLFIIFSDMSCARLGMGSDMALKSSEASVDVVYDDQVRLKGLRPAFETVDFAKASPQLKGKAMSWSAGDGKADITCVVKGDTMAFTLSSEGIDHSDPLKFIGIAFDEMPELAQGVTLWRYKPWNSWTKPILIHNPSEMEDWDIQFFYWQYKDGTYGAAVPLSGQGFRTTLGQHKGRFGTKSVSYGPTEKIHNVPQVIVGFGDDPYKLIDSLYENGLTMIGKKEDLIRYKKMPEQFNTLGWCSWNASDKGRNLNERFIIESVKTFTDNGFPLGWIIVDDGWFDQTGNRLNSLAPSAKRFPNGFKSMNDRLK